MPSPTLLEIMDELGNKIRDGIANVVMDDLQVEPRLNLNPTPPSIDIYPGDPFGDGESAGFGETDGRLFFTVRARVSTADSTAGQDLLLTLLDTEADESIAVSLMDDQTLNGKASSVLVESPSGYTRFDDGGGTGGALLGCTWRVIVLRVFS